MRTGGPWRSALLCLVLTAAACNGDYPRDPDHTLDRVEGGRLRAGLSNDPPFIVLRHGEAPEGREVEMLQAFATSLGATIVWVEDGHADLMQALEERRLDVVVGGHSSDTPWDDRVALSAPYELRAPDGMRTRHVLALPPGENAWLLRFERFVRSPGGAAARGMPPR